MRPDRERLIAHYGFPLDAFQLEALDALDAGASVLVAAPTGSGKTVVAEYAVACALADGARAFYTAPIKALSNQKYHDLCAIHGTDQVGLLTGDNAINADAPVVVMTTEVLRNMIYGGSPALQRLSHVVLDEVHFIQDAYRGPVWEEVIIHLAPEVRLVCLSATVSNADELAEWLTEVRGPTTAVVETKRPVRLDQLYCVGDRTAERPHLFPILVDDRPNAEVLRLVDDTPRRPPRSAATPKRRRPLFTPSRLEVIDRLHDDDLLPAIYFIFSRNQCDEAARHCHDVGMRLTTPTEQRAIREIVDRHLRGIPARDLAVLGAAGFAAQLEAGIAAHHAGLVPPFKEAVEACFVEGLVKVVFATETLAVGVNLPARTVVIEKLSKFRGDHHAVLTPGEYTQLTGRAGRRGIDDLGHAVVLWSPFVPFEQVATLASSRRFDLTSAFRPTYNMTANLVRSFSAEEARRLLNCSLAQFQADRDVVRVETRLQRRRRQLAELEETVASPYGDVAAYRARQRANAPVAAPIGGNAAVVHALAALRPGDVLYLEHGKYAGRVAVLTVAHRKGGVKLQTLTPNRHTIAVNDADFDEAPRVLGHIDLPVPFAPNRQAFQREVARALDRARLAPRPARLARHEAHRGERDPVEDDPDLADRLKAAGHAERIAAEIAGLEGRATRRSGTLARQFDRVLELLGRRGYVDGWALTDAGQELSRTFHECDLLIVECVRSGRLDGLDPAALAALTSVFVYEHRSPEPPPAPWFPSRLVRTRWEDIARISQELRDEEDALGLPVHRAPDATFAAVAYAWAAGQGFAEVVEAEDLSGGDFVRTIKQLIDLLVQLSITAPGSSLRTTAATAADQLFRGVIAASTAIRPGGDE